MKRKVLFVGSFKDKAKDGSVGGQMYASKSLIRSQLSESIEWILLDTTGESVPPPPVYIRFFYAAKRMARFLWLLIFKRRHSVLIFTANSPSIYEKGVMAIIASFFGIKVIIAPRGGPLDKELEQRPRLRKFVTYVLSRVNFVVCQGEYWKTVFSSLLPENSRNKCVVIPNWIDIDQYKIDSRQRSSEDPINILYMGWIQDDKGVNDIFSAIALLKNINRKLNFFFLGDGPARNELMEFTADGKYGFDFFFPGWVHGKEKLDYLSKADIFILASHSEGLPNSLMESMLCGIASISTNVGSVPDLVINGETGILVEKKDINALASGLTALITDDELRKRFSVNGRDRIIKNHSVWNAVDKFKQIL